MVSRNPFFCFMTGGVGGGRGDEASIVGNYSARSFFWAEKKKLFIVSSAWKSRLHLGTGIFFIAKPESFHHKLFIKNIEKCIEIEK